MISFTFGFTHDGKAILLYFGESFAKAEFAERVALESKAYHHVNLYRDLIPDRIYDHESATL
jgi:hypothetical protein